jgi:hypothetical protein
VGEAVTGIDFVGTLPLGSISGTITLDGTGAASTTVNLTGDADAASVTGPGGTYAFANLLAGSYTVSVTPPSGYFFPSTSETVALGIGQTLTGVDFPGIDPGPWVGWEMTLPDTEITLCDGTGATGSCSGVTSVLVKAHGIGDTSLEESLWDEVRFEYSVPGSGTWTEFGTTSVWVMTDNGVNRFFTYQMILVGDDTLPLGPIEVRALGFDGATAYETVANTKITVAAGSVTD